MIGERNKKPSSLPLIAACEEGNAKKVKDLLDKEPTLAHVKRESDDWPLLHIAAYAGHTDVAKVLIDAKVDLNSRTDFERTPLIWACYQDHEKMVSLLVQAGADVNALDEEDNSALHEGMKNYLIVKTLLDAGVDPLIKNEDGQSVLDLYLTEKKPCDQENLTDYLAFMRVALASGKTANEKFEVLEDLSILEFLVELQSTVEVAELREYVFSLPSTNLRFTDEFGRTALHYCEDGTLTKKLLEKGLDLEARDQDGMTPLLYSLKNRDSPEHIIALINAGADVNASATDELGLTPVQMALYYRGYETIVALLNTAGTKIDINKRSSQGSLPLYYFSERYRHIDEYDEEYMDSTEDAVVEAMVETLIKLKRLDYNLDNSSILERIMQRIDSQFAQINERLDRIEKKQEELEKITLKKKKKQREKRLSN